MFIQQNEIDGSLNAMYKSRHLYQLLQWNYIKVKVKVHQCTVTEALYRPYCT